MKYVISLNTEKRERERFLFCKSCKIYQQYGTIINEGPYKSI